MGVNKPSIAPDLFKNFVTTKQKLQSTPLRCSSAFSSLDEFNLLKSI